MKPTIENLREVAGKLRDPHELSLLKDDIQFYIAGAKAAARELGRSINEIETVLDKARAAEEFVTARIHELLPR